MRIDPVQFIGIVLVAVFVAACAAPRGRAIPPATPPARQMSDSPHPGAAGASVAPSTTAETIVLPAPRLASDVSLEEALARRRSVRFFAETPLTLTELGQLLWAAQGITAPDGRRTAPSAGALYPLEIYAVTTEAAYRYEPHEHRLIVHAPGDRRPALHQAALQQSSVLQAPMVLVIAGVYERTAVKYGGERAPRYVHLEAGHAAQNVLLQAVALGLGAVPIGAFYDHQVQQALALPPDHQPLYLIPLGHAR